nr:uncharacterized protein LOC117833920 isoform X2 [Setaria viridis]
MRVLAEDYYNSHHHQHGARKLQQQQRKPAKATTKGLNLILRHNSLYAQATTDTDMMPPPQLVSLAWFSMEDDEVMSSSRSMHHLRKLIQLHLRHSIQ